MIKIKCHGSWCDNDTMLNVVIKRQVQDPEAMTFGSIQYVNGDDFDYMAIFNYPNDSYPPLRTIGFQCEPKPIREIWPTKFTAWKDFTIDGGNYHMPIMWHLPVDYNYLKNDRPEKSKVLSACLTTKQTLEGHRLRYDFANEYLRQLPYFELYGPAQEWASHPSFVCWAPKHETHRPFKYVFNAENFSEPRYFTEKLYDAILTESLCFYWGCPDVEEYIDPETFIRIDITKPQEALETIKSAIENNEWEKRIDAIRAEKHRILDETQVLAFLDKTLKGD